MLQQPISMSQNLLIGPTYSDSNSHPTKIIPRKRVKRRLIQNLLWHINNYFTYLKKCTEMNPAAKATENFKKLISLFFQNDWARSINCPNEKCTGAIKRAEIKLKYKTCEKCGETAWASFAPALKFQDGTNLAFNK